MSDNKPYDLLLRGGHVICPASEINGVMDVAVRDGKIAAVQKDILPASAKEVVDVRGRLVLPGLIDTHAHCYRYVTGRFGLEADMVGVRSGVTTVIDQGGARQSRSCPRGEGACRNRRLCALGYPGAGAGDCDRARRRHAAVCAF